MSTTLKAEFTGQVAVAPRLVRVVTSDTEAEIKSAGWINQYEEFSGVTIVKNDVVFVSWEDGESTGIFLPEFGANREITLKGIAGDGGGSFPDQVNTYFVSKAGDDSNSGKNPGDAKLTINGAINAIPDITVRSVIYIIDGETYVENVELAANGSLIIMGTNATIETVDAPVSVAAGGLLVLDVYGVTGGAGDALLADGNDQIIVYSVTMTGTVKSDNGGRIDIDTEFLTGDIIADDEMHGSIDTLTGDLTKVSATVADLNMDIGKIDGDIVLNSSQTTIRVGELTGSITLTETAPGDSFFTAAVERIAGGYSLTESIANNPRGFIGNIVYGTYDVQNEWLSSNNSSTRGFSLSSFAQALDYTFVAGDSGRNLIITAASNIELYAPDAATAPGLPIGWSCLVTQASSGNGRINVMGSDNLSSVSGKRWTEGRGSVSRLTLVAEGGGIRNWSWGGQIAGSSFAEDTEIFVSQLDGDDATATGSESQPFATIQAAVDFAETGGAPANPVAVVVMDGETYTETVTISQPNIALLAPLATLAQTGANNVLVITTLSPNPFFANVGIIRQPSTGLCISHTGTSPTVIKAASIIGPNSTFPTIDFGDADGTLIVDAVILGRITVNNGDVTYRATTRTRQSAILGTGSIKGIALTGVDAEKWSMTNGAEAVGDFEIWDSNWSKEFLIQKNSVGTGWQMTITDDPQQADVTMYLPSFPTDWRILGTSVVPDLGANLIAVDASIPYTALATAGTPNVFVATSGASYRIREIFLNSDSTDFSGGDRTIEIFAGASSYTIIPTGTLASIGNARWGTTAVPYPATLPINDATPAGANLQARYEVGVGTTDYTAGALEITVIYERVS